MIIFHGNGLIIFPLFLMGKIRSVYVLFGISPRIWDGLRTYTKVPLYLYIVTTSNYSAISNLYILQFTTARTKPSQFVFSSRC
jgi:hypothetical protein